jgi:hypothetical protein
MDDIKYDSIVANVAQVNVDGAQVKVTWKCPVSGRTVGESTAWMAADPSLGSRVGASVKRSIAYEIIYGAARMISGMVGGAVGRVINNAVYTAAGDLNNRATADVDYSEQSRQTAIVAAFETVKSSFAWDEGRRQFIAR